MSSDEAGLQMAISSNLHEKIKEQTGMDLSILMDPERALALMELRERAKERKDRLTAWEESLKKGIIKAQRKLKEVKADIEALDHVDKELDRLDRNGILKDYIQFRDRAVKSDISKIGMSAGHIHKTDRNASEVMG